MADKSESKKSIKFIKLRIKAFWLEHELKIVLICGFILVAAVAFEFGMMQGQKWQQKPLIIEKLAPQAVQNSDPSNFTTSDPKTASGANLALQKDCAFVGSKNSNKYHLPTCQWAKRIKPENVVCFKSAQDAAAKNYLPDKNCIK